MQNQTTVSQKAQERFEQVRAYLEAHRALFSTQGSVVATWRVWQGRKLGPYFRLAFREGRRQCSLYLGRCQWLAEQVRGLLGRIQEHVRWRRQSFRLQREARAALRKAKAQLKAIMAIYGVRMKGFEFRGIARAFPLTCPVVGWRSPAAEKIRKNVNLLTKTAGSSRQQENTEK